MKNAQYTALPRAQVRAACPPPTLDCRDDHERTPNTSTNLYRAATYDVLAMRTERTSRAKVERDNAADLRNYTTGLDTRVATRSGNAIGTGSLNPKAADLKEGTLARIGQLADRSKRR